MATGKQSLHTRCRTALIFGLITTASVAVAAGCSPAQPKGAAGADQAPAATTYVAHLAPLNTKTTGTSAAGDVTFTLSGDSLTITTDATGLPKDLAHWQHFHGFKDGKDAACPAATADANGDGVVDLIETGPAAGTTMVPFNDDPVAMDIPKDTYPKSSAAGTLHYQKTVSLSALEAAFGKAFDGQKLDLDKRVVFLHGVSPDTKLAASVASLGPIPAQVTIPIACGKITRVK
jgi:hypothetical protein